MQTTLIALAVLALLFWVLHSLGTQMSKKEAMQKAVTSAKGRPTSHLASWAIHYMDGKGESTRRTIHILTVKPNLGQIEAWCDMRNEKRTFLLERIKLAADAQTGEIVDIEAWLLAYRRSRRKPKAA